MLLTIHYVRLLGTLFANMIAYANIISHVHIRHIVVSDIVRLDRTQSTHYFKDENYCGFMALNIFSK